MRISFLKRNLRWCVQEEQNYREDNYHCSFLLSPCQWVFAFWIDFRWINDGAVANAIQSSLEKLFSSSIKTISLTHSSPFSQSEKILRLHVSIPLWFCCPFLQPVKTFFPYNPQLLPLKEKSYLLSVDIESLYLIFIFFNLKYHNIEPWIKEIFFFNFHNKERSIYFHILLLLSSRCFSCFCCCRNLFLGICRITCVLSSTDSHHKHRCSFLNIFS